MMADRKAFSGGIGPITEFRNSSAERFLHFEQNLAIIRAGIRGSYSRRGSGERKRKKERDIRRARLWPVAGTTTKAFWRAWLIFGFVILKASLYSHNNFLFSTTFFRKINFRCILVRKKILFYTRVYIHQRLAKLFGFRENNLRAQREDLSTLARIFNSSLWFLQRK